LKTASRAVLDQAGDRLRANHQPLGQGMLVGLVAVLVVLRKARGGMSAASLARINAGMSPYALAVANRLFRGEEWTPPAPDGLTPADFQKTPALLQHNLTFEEARAFNGLIPTIDGPVPTLKPFILPGKGAERERAELCLTQAVYYEAGFETGEGQQAVAQVILNRLRHPAYPKSVCGVVYQGSQRTTGCQFSFTCDGSLLRAPSPAAWDRARYVAKTALNGFVYKGVGTSTHYHADYVFPYWAVTLVKLKQIGAHIFYRMTGPPGTVAGFDGKYAGGEMALSAAVLQGGDTRTPDAPSVATPVLANPAALPQQTFTLTLGGETRSYLVNPPVLPGQQVPQGSAQPGTALAGTVVYGTLNQGRRMPTVEEMADINEKLRVLEEKLQADRAAGKTGLPGEK